VEYDYSDKNRRRSRLYIGVGLFTAISVAGLVLFALQSSAILAEPVEMRAVVVAARDIASRKPIEEGDVVTRVVAADPTNESAYTEIADVLGRVSGVSITAGELVTRSMLAAAVTGQTFSILEAGEEFDPNGPDLRAVSVDVPDDRAVAGTLVPGQRVDLVVTLAINPEIGTAAESPSPEPSASPGANAFIAGPSTKVTLQMLTVLARNGSIYILRTDLGTAEKIAELTAAGGQFTLVLRPDEDARTPKTVGSTLDMLLDEFGFPIPKQPNLEEPPTP
jgi:Flp pilus assembly protein CpaB